MKILALALLIFSTSVFALDVDEKLTVRIIKTSETRKTIMINRGTEDGLVEGDHAKFIMTAGIVARAVLIKLSPTRSIWSVYRLVNADYITNDSVMTIKITPPVKITKDESQMLVQEDTPTKVGVGDATTLGIPLAEGANDISTAEDQMNQADLKSLEEATPTTIVEKNWEIFSMLNISGLSGATKTESGSTTYKNSMGNYYIGLGGEYYPQKERSWYSHFSLIASVNFSQSDSQAYTGATATNAVTEFAGGVNWHPTKLPSMTSTFIPFINLMGTMGSVKSTFKPGQENAGGPSYSTTGVTGGFSVGYGYKYYTSSGFGARILLDYYFRSEKYKQDAALDKFSKTVAGPRLMLGLSYRF